MDIHPNQPLPLEYQLPKDVYHHLIHSLIGALPLPIPNTPENLIRRDNAAIARIAAMLPANPDEASLATQYISAQDQSLESMRLGRRPGLDDKAVKQFIAEANGMMRQANATRRLLLRLQSDRQKREANGKTLDQANWLEHCVMSLMADALGRTPPGPIAQATPDPEPLPDEEEPEPDLATEAEHYAIIYTEARRADPLARWLAAQLRFRPTQTRACPRHRHRHHAAPVRPRQSRQSQGHRTGLTGPPSRRAPHRKQVGHRVAPSAHRVSQSRIESCFAPAVTNGSHADTFLREAPFYSLGETLCALSATLCMTCCLLFASLPSHESHPLVFETRARRIGSAVLCRPRLKHQGRRERNPATTLRHDSTKKHRNDRS